MAEMYTAGLHSDLTTQKWDAIIIGSGLGGMTSGTLLAQAGKKVLILERHYCPGGFTHTFKRKGYEWDVGVHYVGQVSKKNSPLRKIFDYVTEKKLEWAPMGDVYDQAIIEGEVFDFVVGSENQQQKLIGYFPEEAEAIKKYMKLVKSAAGSSAWFFGEKTMPRWMSKTFGKLLRFRFEAYAKKTTFDVLNSLTTNQKLISVLCAQCGNYGLPPKSSSFGIHAMVVAHYFDGGNYPIGGARQIHSSILKVFKKFNGRLVLKAEVAGLILEKNKAVGVKMFDGLSLFAPVIISNAGASNTFEKLLPPKKSLPVVQTNDFDQVKASTAHVCLYVGLKGSAKELNLPKNNIWIYDESNFDDHSKNEYLNPMAEKTLIYISFPSAKDPDWEQKNPGKSTVQVIAACSHDVVSKWQEQPFARRDHEYLGFKRDVTEKLKSKLIKVMPQLKEQIDFCELSTPLSTQHFMNYPRGEIYGLEHTPERFRLKNLRPQTLVPGLFLVGQDVVTVGVGGALYSGVLAATKVLNKSVIMRILFNRKL